MRKTRGGKVLTAPAGDVHERTCDRGRRRDGQGRQDATRSAGIRIEALVSAGVVVPVNGRSAANGTCRI